MPCSSPTSTGSSSNSSFCHRANRTRCGQMPGLQCKNQEFRAADAALKSRSFPVQKLRAKQDCKLQMPNGIFDRADAKIANCECAPRRMA